MPFAETGRALPRSACPDFGDAAPPDRYAAREEAVSFRCAGLELAVLIRHVREIVELPGALPAVDERTFLRGTVTVQGEAMPVLDLGARLGAGETTLTFRSCALVLDVPRVAILVDAARDLLDFAPEEIVAPPRLGMKEVPVAAFGAAGGRLVPVLDVRALLPETPDEREPASPPEAEE